MKEDNLIFISSLPRSGSTLLQRLIAENSSVYTESESWILLPILDANGELIIESVYGRNTAAEAISEFLKDIDLTEYDSVVKNYILGLYGIKMPAEKKYFLDKTPRYYLISERLESIFPKAKHVYIKRNPLAVLASIYNTWVKDDLDSLINYQVDLVDGVRILSRLLPITSHQVISYEDLISNPESELATIRHYLGFDDSEASIEYSALDKDWSLGDQVKVNALNKPTDEFINDWISSLSDETLWNLLRQYLLSLEESILGNLGYDKKELNKILEDACIEHGHNVCDIRISGFKLSEFFEVSYRFKAKQSFYELRKNSVKYFDLLNKMNLLEVRLSRSMQSYNEMELTLKDRDRKIASQQALIDQKEKTLEYGDQTKDKRNKNQ